MLDVYEDLSCILLGPVSAWSRACRRGACGARVGGRSDYCPLVRRVLLLPRIFGMVDALLALMADPQSALCGHVRICATDTEAPRVFTIPHALGHRRRRHDPRMPARCRQAARPRGHRRSARAALVGNCEDALEEDGLLDVRARLLQENLHGLEYAVINVLGSVGQVLLTQTTTLASSRTLLDTAAAALECLVTLLKPHTLPAQTARSIVRSGVTILAASRTISRRYRTQVINGRRVRCRVVSQ